MKQQMFKIKDKEVYARYGQAHRYKPTSLKLISRVGLDAKILDAGGGDRSLDLPNFVNLDIERKSGMVNVIGDLHQLPFKSNIFDLILFEAVVEHCKKPWIVVEELYRVLRIDGFIYVDAAFMQPLHSFPHHYFNMTKEGLEVLFERFRKLGSGVQEYQMPSYTVLSVLFNYARCLLPSLDKVGKDITIYDTGVHIRNHGHFLSSPLLLIYSVLSRFFHYLDRFIKLEKAEVVAAGVYFMGQKYPNNTNEYKEKD
jgi:SAM-dependent methyltransferase